MCLPHRHEGLDGDLEQFQGKGPLVVGGLCEVSIRHVQLQQNVNNTGVLQGLENSRHSHPQQAEMREIMHIITGKTFVLFTFSYLADALSKAI